MGSRRDESQADAFFSFAPRLPRGVRLWAARRAAARGLGPSALRAAPDDPLVLTRLGMHGRALATTDGGRTAALARAAAAAATGDLAPARSINSAAGVLSTTERRLLASSAAPFNPGLALALLPPSDLVNRAACALAAKDLELAQSLLDGAAACQQSRYLVGALAAWQGDWERARASLNRAFAADGLLPPLAPSAAAPTTLAAFRSTSTSRVDGPLITVVMAAKNAAATLAVAADSLLAQTWRSLEVMVIDDHSTDETLALAHDIARRDARLRVLSNLRSPGAYGARNTGVAAARGAIIALHDADDWAHPQRLERQMASLGSSKGMTLCRHFRVDGAGRPVCPRVFPFVRLSPITAMARASAFAALGPFEEVAVGGDSEWLARFDNRFGRRAAPRTSEVGLVALWDADSLSGSPASGLVAEGLTARLAYVEAWRRRHAGLA